jgi:hypothetical protein
MSGKYDPPDKARLMATFRRTPCTPELMVAAAEAQFPLKVKHVDGASRATATETGAPVAHSHTGEADKRQKRGRKPVVTAQRVQMICELLATGETERACCVRAGIGSTAWNAAKRADSTLRDRLASARDDWARLRHAQYVAALYESQVARSAGQKALKPHPTKQANMVFWYLVKRVPLNFVALPENEIAAACERFRISIETWRRQECAFGLLRKIYTKRAAIRGGESGF